MTRLGIALLAFALAWLVATLAAGWLFGSGNILVWLFAAAVGVLVYIGLSRHGGASHSMEKR